LRLAIAAVALLVAGTTARADTTIEVDDCGARISARQRGVLQHDVSCGHHCSDTPAVACDPGDVAGACGGSRGTCVADGIVLENHATLDLNGHTVQATSDATVVTCELPARVHGRCAVHGPGTLLGAKGRGIDGGTMDLEVRDVTFGSFAHAIFTQGRMVASGLATLPDWANEIQVVGNVVLRRSHVNGLAGVSGAEVYVADVAVGPDGGEVRAGRSLRGRGVLLRGQTSLHGRRILLRDVTATSGESFLPSSIGAEDTLRLVASRVAEISAGRRPVLIQSTCERSRVFGEDETWGVCSGD
jgi:hypothetical protein